MLGEEQIKFVSVTDNYLLSFIKAVKEKIIIAKPAYRVEEIETILNEVENKNINCKLFLELDEGSIREGLGEAESLELIRENFEILNAQVIDKVKMVIVVVDNKSLIYSPIVSLHEEDLFKETIPNGLLVNSIITEQIIMELFNNEKELSIKGEKLLLFLKSELSKDKCTNIEESIVKTINRLRINPPIGITRLRRVNFYRNNYKLVKIQSIGIRIKNKKISLRPFIRMLENQDEREARSWNIFSAEDLKKLGDTKLFYSELKKIIENFLLDAGRFGYILNIYRKQEFDKEINKLKVEFLEFIKGENKDNKSNRFYRIIKFANSKTEDNLESILDNSRELLTNYLLKISEKDKRMENEIYKKDRLLLLERNEKNLSEEEVRKIFIKRYITNTLKFPTSKDIIDRIDVKVDYFDISDELISDNKDFKKVLNKHNTHNIKQLRLMENSN